MNARENIRFGTFLLVITLLVSGRVPAQELSQGGQDSVEKTESAVEVLSGDALSQEMPVEPESDEFSTAPVIFHGRELFSVGAVFEIRADQRAQELVDRLDRLAKSPRVRTDSLIIRDNDNLGVSLIFAGSEIVHNVWQQEAEVLSRPRREIAEEQLRIMGEAIEGYRHDFSLRSIIMGIVFTALATGVLLLLLYLINLLRKREEAFMERRLAGKKLGKVSIGADLTSYNHTLMRLLRLVTVLGLFMLYLHLVLSFFPWTFGIAAYLFDLIISPLKKFGHDAIDQIPSLFTLAIIIIITVFLLRIIRRLFDHLKRGTIKIKAFYPDWSDTTFNLVRIIVIAFAVVAAFPYIPGSKSPAFKGMSIFIGVLFSLGSTSAVANVIAGLILTYMRPFVEGDRVKVNDNTGTVLERRMLSTRIRTPKNELVAIPNSAIISSAIINYSSLAKEKGLLLHTSVTIGYDTPWRTVHDLLIRAARKTSDVLPEPEPFVLQTSLGDFYICYELNVATDRPDRCPRIYSDLHQNIQDTFAESGVEITSPHFRQNRDEIKSTIPQQTTRERTMPHDDDKKD